MFSYVLSFMRKGKIFSFSFVIPEYSAVISTNLSSPADGQHVCYT